MFKRTLPLFVALIAGPASAQFSIYNDSGGPLRHEQAVFDVGFYDLFLAIDPAARTINGSLRMEATIVSPTDVVLLDLDDALGVRSVESVHQDMMEPLEFERGAGTIRVHLGRTFQPGERVNVAVGYGGTPRVAPNPPWDGGLTWSTTEDGQPWVGVSCQINGADLWWPTKDHPSDEVDSMRVTLQVPGNLRAIANGRWEGRTENSDGSATESWFISTPINNYGVSFGVAPYVEVTRQYESPVGWSDPITFYVLPERKADAERQMDQFMDNLAYLERTFGPYAWREDGYKILHTPYYGMEHQSLIAYGSTFTNNAFGIDNLHFHELAHEWWANLGSAADWKDFWIHESFASYADAIYAEDLVRRGIGMEGVTPDEAYLRAMAGKRGRVLNRLPVAPHDPTSTHDIYKFADGSSNSDVYSKGAWVIHSLRYLINDDAKFLNAMRRILYPTPESETITDGRQARFIAPIDVRNAFERAAGRSLETVFDAYLHTAALPVLDATRDGDQLVLRWIVGAGLDPTKFDVPVEVRVGAQTRRVEMTGGVGRLAVPAGAEWQVDPNGRTLFEPGEGLATAETNS